MGGANFNTRSSYTCIIKVPQKVGFTTKSCTKILTAACFPYLDLSICIQLMSLKIDNKEMYLSLK